MTIVSSTRECSSLRNVRRGALAATLLAMVPAVAMAHDPAAPVRADGHAPIGVMGDHMHKKGEWMLSYRYMRMDMEGNRIGTNDVSPDTIVSTVPNAFAPPPMLRIVPLWMTMDMHMLGLMYAPSNDLTLMVMGNYINKEMRHVTYQGMAGTNVLGYFTTETEGWSDTKVSGLYRLYDDAYHNHVHLNLGLSLPTGSITERGTVLTPMNMQNDVRLPYAMQLGTGTFDLLPGLTYTGRNGDFSWGAQYRAEIRLGENDEDYAWGDKHAVTGWLAYEWAAWISTSVRLDASTQGQIEGMDPNIAGPVQTANPMFYGGERVDAYLGVNLAGQTGAIRGHRLALEVGMPIYQDLNGPQMESDWTLTVGWQKAF